MPGEPAVSEAPRCEGWGLGVSKGYVAAVESARASMSSLKVVLHDIMMSAASMTLERALAYRAVELATKQPATSRTPTVTLGTRDHTRAPVVARRSAATCAATAFDRTRCSGTHCHLRSTSFDD